MIDIAYFFDLFMNLDKHLSVVTSQYGTLTYLLLFAIVFCETGLVVTPFFPGDSLIFATGALAATGSLKLSTLLIILSIAAIAGDTVNYEIGHLLRNRVSSNENLRFIKKEHLDRTHAFFEKYGVQTIIIARFIPIIRTFAPFVAGVGEMPYSKFISYNVVGGVLWVSLFLYGGYSFGSLPIVKNNFSLVILGIIFVSLIPGIVTYIQSRRTSKSA